MSSMPLFAKLARLALTLILSACLAKIFQLATLVITRIDPVRPVLIANVNLVQPARLTKIVTFQLHALPASTALRTNLVKAVHSVFTLEIAPWDMA